MIQTLGRFGVYSGEGSVLAFSIDGLDDPLFSDTSNHHPQRGESYKTVGAYRLLCRGAADTSCEEIAESLKANRLMPSLINKQVELLYGRGPRIYRITDEDGQSGADDGISRNWVKQGDIQSWLESWQANGIEMSYTDFAAACIKSFYFFRDFFVKWRTTAAPGVGGAVRFAGLEFVDNRFCRLGTQKPVSDRTPLSYSDFSVVAYGNYRESASSYKIYPLFRLREVDRYKFAAISHHKESSPGEIYGLNEVYEGIKEFLKTSNDLPVYIGSFLKNALAAKVHVVIPNAWVEAKRTQMKAICKENEKRVKAGESAHLFEGIDVGTEFLESNLVLLIQNQLRQISKFLSGSRNQGKAFSSFSFTDNSGNEQRWKIEEIDLKYKEYIEALDNHDKRIDEVLVSSVGLDSSISAISKPGMISKSGSDTYYNLLLYLMTLTIDDEKCCEPFNWAIRVNFPELYKQGYRIGFYRPLPAKQSEVSPKNRFSNQASE
ncbi:portal protein [Porphyromonas phage phage019b_ATCC49417]|uniref:Uncharacterized protein n=2 Tax=root TaxID=1 RepID=A0AAE9XD32_PORGN|nr:hypothetical protein [Porphyromonas gingivalis]WCG02176.1 hypothetical protein NY151_05670 [Porphyromonas gingivalis]SJL32945.1 hypothetical protein PGIN_ATCC49417_01712 [Porphyromonas gingivalis]